MRNELPLLIGSLYAAIVIFDYYIKLPALQAVAKEIIDWGVIMSAFALVLASMNMVRKHGRAVMRREKNSLYSGILLVLLIAMAFFGITQGTNSAPFRWLYDNVMQSVSPSIYASVAFYLLSAAFRTFRARNLDATLLLLSAGLVLVGRSTIGTYLWEGLGSSGEWLLAVPNAAANRAVLIGAALGMVSTGIRLLTGIDRAYLGSE